MTQALAQEDLLPYASSAYAWRWQDPRHRVLPAEILGAIQALRPERARQLFPRSLELDAWAREAPGRVLDVEAASPAEVKDWLRKLAAAETPVIVSWHSDDAVRAPWRVFADYWDAFWYPASDDITAFPLDETWALSCDHEGRYSWKAQARLSRKKRRRKGAPSNNKLQRTRRG